MARILCVEDEPDIRADIVEELTDLGHSVATAENGEQGLRVAVDFRPQLILCDCLMPAMTGPEMIRALRDKHPEFSSTPCVVLSAFSDETHIEEVRSAGADAYLTKPTNFDELESLLNRLLNGSEES